jgi:uncharacterized membrane protein YqjE
MNNGYTKSVADVLAELKVELLEFVSTRLAMAHSEIKENLQSLKLAGVALIVGLLLLGTSWLLFTSFLVAMIAVAFEPSPWAYVLAMIIVTAAYLVLGGLMATRAWKRLSEKGITPRRTIHVLQQDKIWIQAESKGQL